MSTTCRSFVSNTWRKDVCTNCFRLRDEHGISVSGRITANKFSSSNSSMMMTKNNSSSEFHPAKSDNTTIPRMSGSTVSGGGIGGSANLTQSHFGTGSTFISHSQNTQQQQQVLQNKSSLRSSGGGVNSGSRQSNVSFASGGPNNISDNKFRDIPGMDTSQGDRGESRSGGDGGGRKPQFNVGGPMRGGGQRGILKSRDGSKTSKSGGRRGVSFPKEVVEVIGIGDDDEPRGASSSDEDDTPIDPQDNSSIAELLEKNSTTMDEKEFHRLTQKNTNFNSIKTNLLGKTNIEIGPIVGGTGGSSKPLVSIGTFETRNEPLRIRKKIDEDSTDDYDKTVNSHRKFVASTIKTTTTASLPTRPPPVATTTSTPQPHKPPPAQVPTFFSSSADSASKSMQNVSIGSSNVTKSSKLYSSHTSKSTVITKTVQQNTTPISVPTPPTTTTTKKPDQVDSSCSKPDVKHHVSISSAKDSERWNEPEAKNEVSQGSLNKGPNGKPALKPKSILKCSQNSSPSTTTTSTTTGKTTPIITSPISNTIPPILSSNRISELKSNASAKSNSALTNLIILTEGNSIASKRTSFLRDIIDGGNNQDKIIQNKDTTISTTPSSDIHGVTIVATTGVNPSLDCSQPSLEKDSLESPKGQTPSKPTVPSKLKLNIDLSLNREVTNPPKPIVPPSLRFNENGSGTDSEFDDSLEDSGLDIKITKPRIATVPNKNKEEGAFLSEESDENEKVGGGSSGSDSGNENDYAVINNKCSGRVNKGHAGLYISVEDEELKLNINTPAKLSPDSVLSNSASGSEMSASGSNESIPESLHHDEQERRPSTTSTSSANKRQAPQPPNNVAESPFVYDDDDVYDDVVNVKKCLSSNDLDIEDESIYDNCATLDNDRTITANSNNNLGKIGSYNFQQESSQLGGDHCEDDVEPVITHRSDGIEFIGIRKIDAESFLKEMSPTPDRRFGFRRSVSPGKSSRERSSSTSPKTRRKVNQFFSTIGKKAGAAFSNSQLGQYARTKSPSVFTGSNADPNGLGGGEKSYNYKRSMSTDEVSATRAQEIYATVTPTTLKFKGVLNKLSKIDLNLSDKNKDQQDFYEGNDPSKDKMYKKNIGKSIKKFLRFGGNKDGAGDGGKYDFQQHVPLNISSPMHNTPTNSLTTSEESSSNPASMSPSIISDDSRPAFQQQQKPPLPSTKPPPPPPRVHSLDMLQKMGVVNQKGTVRPARPPPPVRPNQVAPSFTAVFNHHPSPSDATSPTPIISENNNTLNDDGIPPCKPRRKNSIVGGGRDLETSYNHISNLNLETLKLIANQPLTKIVSNFPVISSEDNVQWSQFDIQTGMRPDPLIHGMGFAIYSAHFEGTKCLLMIQESTYSSPLQFSCVQTDLTFQDSVPIEYIPWDPSERVKCDIGIRATLSVLPFFKTWNLEDFTKSSEIVPKEKYLALLQSLEFWDLKELSYLLVFRQPHIVSSDRIYIHPTPILGGKQRSSSNLQSSDFEVSIKQLLFTSGDDPEDGESVLSGSDKRILIEKVSGAQDEVKSQLKLFFQLKLFSPPVESGEFLKIRKYRSEHAIQQWLDKERAMCMKEAVERSLSGGSITSDAITPLKKAYLDFLMRPGNSAKAILDMFVDLFE